VDSYLPKQKSSPRTSNPFPSSESLLIKATLAEKLRISGVLQRLLERERWQH
jgi:hypothetical protein